MPEAPRPDAVLESLMNTTLYSIGAAFTDNHPDLVDDAIQASEEIEAAGVQEWSQREDATLDAALETLVTGLALRYYRALSG